MLILVTGPKGERGKSICAVNLACELAGLDSLAADRWQGEHSVVLVDADEQGNATRCCSGGHLPVSAERLLPGADIEKWLRKMRAIGGEVDYVVVDGPSGSYATTRAIVGISALVVIPCTVSSAHSEPALPIMELIKEARSVRTDGGPKCLLVPIDAGAGTAPANEVEHMLANFGEPVGPVVHQWTEFEKAFNSGRWIGSFAPKSAAYAEIKELAVSVGRTLTCITARV